MKVDDFKKIVESFVKFLEQKGFDNKQAIQATDGLFQIIISSSLIKIYDQLSDNQKKEISTQVSNYNKGNQFEELESLIKNLSGYISGDKISAVFREESQLAIEGFLKSIHNK